MASELVPGQFSVLFARLGVEAEARAVLALAQCAAMTERQAKINASNGEHPYGTPTPSSGDPRGPARISGTLVRSITHTEPAKTATGWEALVGVASGLYPRYRTHTSKTPSSKYGYYLEVTGVRNGRKFPFLKPALSYTNLVGVHVIFNAVFGVGWRLG